MKFHDKNEDDYDKKKKQVFDLITLSTLRKKFCWEINLADLEV